MSPYLTRVGDFRTAWLIALLDPRTRFNLNPVGDRKGLAGKLRCVPAKGERATHKSCFVPLCPSFFLPGFSVGRA